MSVTTSRTFSPRCYVFGKRIHHGFVGALMVAVGAALAWDDRRDFPWSPNEH